MMSQIDQSVNVSSSDSDQEDRMQVSKNPTTQGTTPHNNTLQH
jgi:hypothetical protein